jgi:hypothetical protein
MALNPHGLPESVTAWHVALGAFFDFFVTVLFHLGHHLVKFDSLGRIEPVFLGDMMDHLGAHGVFMHRPTRGGIQFHPTRDVNGFLRRKVVAVENLVHAFASSRKPASPSLEHHCVARWV